MGNSTKLTYKDMDRLKKANPPLSKLCQRADNLFEDRNSKELFRIEKYYTRLLKKRLNNESDEDLLKCVSSYLSTLNSALYNADEATKQQANRENKKYQNEPETQIQKTAVLIPNNILTIVGKVNTKQTMTIEEANRLINDLQEQIISEQKSLIMKLQDRNSGLSEYVDILEKTTNKRKGGTIVYFGNLCIEKN